MDAKRILVTGAAGFIGSAVVRALQADPAVQVCSYDLLTYAGHRANLEDLPDPDRHALVVADVCDAAGVTQALDESGAEAVIHCAAETHVDRSLVDATPFVRTNVEGTRVLLDACHARGIRLVVVSTDEVYGDLPAPLKATPDTPLAPSNPYAATKAAGDLLALAQVRSRGQDVVITRCGNNYGPRQSPEKFVPRMILRALAGETLPIYGDGQQVRPWIHVTDHAEGIVRALRGAKAGSVHHFCGTRTPPNVEVAKALLDALDVSLDRLAFVADRPGHDRRYALDDHHTRDALGWTPTQALDAGLAATARWYQEHRAWLEATASDDLRAFLERNYASRDVNPA